MKSSRKMKLVDFYNIVNTVSSERPSVLRHGQYAMKVLYSRFPLIYNAITGTSFDPFYNDDILVKFWAHLLNEYVEC